MIITILLFLETVYPKLLCHFIFLFLTSHCINSVSKRNNFNESSNFFYFQFIQYILYFFKNVYGYIILLLISKTYLNIIQNRQTLLPFYFVVLFTTNLYFCRYFTIFPANYCFMWLDQTMFYKKHSLNILFIFSRLQCTIVCLFTLFQYGIICPAAFYTCTV